MRFIVGKSNCRGCGRPLDVMDDMVAVTPVVAGGGPWSGFFHRDCFARLPDSAALTRSWHEYMEKQVRSRSRFAPVVAASARFIIVRRDVEKMIGLYYLDWLAEQRFHAEEWEEFVEFVLGDALNEALAGQDEAEILSQAEQFAVRLGPNPHRAQLSWTTPIGREIEFPAAPFEAYTAAHGPLAGDVNFAALAAEGELTPLETYGDLARCQGTVTRVDSTPRGYEVVYTARQPVAVELGRDGLAELQRVVAKVHI